jgi:hypothetical protein
MVYGNRSCTRSGFGEFWRFGSIAAALLAFSFGPTTSVHSQEPIPAELWEQVDPSLRPKAGPVAPNAEGMRKLRELRAVLDASDGFVALEMDDHVHRDLEGNVKPLDDAARTYLNEHQKVFDLADEFIRVGGVQPEALEWDLQLVSPYSTLIALRIRHLVDTRQFDELRQHCEINCKLAQLFVETRSFVWETKGHILNVGVGDGVLGYANDVPPFGNDVPVRVFEELLASTTDVWSAANHEETVVENLASTIMPTIAKLPESNDLEDAITALLDLFPQGAKSDEVDKIQRRIKGQLSRRKELVWELLKDHPNPVDRAETVKLASQFMLEARANMLRPWSEQKWPLVDRTLSVSEQWPEEISLSETAYLSVMLGGTQKDVSDEVMKTAQENLRDIPNVLGVHILKVSKLPMLVSALRRLETGNAAMRISLAVRVYRARHAGEYPNSLDDLVKAGILPTVPDDPFGTKMKYSRDQRYVWSVGFDGQDNQARPERDRPFTLESVVNPQRGTQFREGDLVWSVVDGQRIFQLQEN